MQEKMVTPISWSMEQKTAYLQNHGKAIVREAQKYATPNNGSVLLNLGITVFGYVGLFFLAFWVYDKYGFLYALPFIICTALLVPRFVGTQHDCGHRSYLKNDKLRDWIGIFCSIFTLLPYEYWAGEHNYHHVHNNKIETNHIGDIKTITVERFKKLPIHARNKYRKFRNPWNLIILGGPKYVLLLNRFFRHENIKELRKYKKSVIRTNIMLFVVYTGLTILLGVKFLVICLIVWCIYGINDVWFFYVQHQFESAVKYMKSEWNFIEAALLGSSRYKLPWILNFTTTNIGEHPLHHLMANIPHYRLRKAWKKIMEKFPDLQHIITEITFRDSIKCAYLALYDKENQKMITFKEFDREYST